VLAHDPLDRIHGCVVRVVERAGAIQAKLPGQSGEVERRAVVDVAAVTAGGLAHDTFGLEQGDAGALLRERERGGQAGEAPANDGDVDLALYRALGSQAEGFGRVLPVGDEFHAPVQIPSKRASPPMSST
jgi:hypothetical protein